MVQSSSSSLLSELNEAKPVDTSLLAPIDRRLLTVEETGEVVVTLAGENGRYQNSLGYYTVNEDGTFGSVGLLFADTNSTKFDPDNPEVDDGKGSLVEGISQASFGSFAAGTEIGFFLLANGAALNGDLDPTASFRLEKADGSPAGIADGTVPRLVQVGADGQEVVLQGDLMFTTDPTGEDFANALNSGGAGQAIAGTDEEGDLLIAFEDLRAGHRFADLDFNDLVIEVTTIASGEPSPTQTATDQATIPSTGQTLAASLTSEVATTDDVIEIEGFINLGGIAQPPFNVAFVIDTSGSMLSDFGGDVGDLNGDGRFNTRLDGAIAAFEALNQSIIEDGLQDVVDIKIITIDTVSSTSEVLDPGEDVDDALEALQLGGITNYADALDQAGLFFDAQAGGTNIVYFASDGNPNTGGSYEDELTRLTDVHEARIDAIGIGTAVTETVLDAIDSDGEAQITTTPEELEADLGAAPIAPADLASVEILLDGDVVQTIDVADLTVTPFGLRFAFSLTGIDITDGVANQVSVRVVGSDGDATTVQPTLSVADPGSAPVAPLVLDLDDDAPSAGSSLSIEATLAPTGTELASLLQEPAASQVIAA